MLHVCLISQVESQASLGPASSRPAWLLLRTIAQGRRAPSRVQEEFQAAYTVGAKLGEGSFARVASAVRVRDGVLVAIKTYKDKAVMCIGVASEHGHVCNVCFFVGLSRRVYIVYKHSGIYIISLGGVCIENTGRSYFYIHIHVYMHLYICIYIHIRIYV